MVPADSDRIPRAPPYSGVTLTDHALPVRGCHPLRRSFPNSFRFLRSVFVSDPTTPPCPRTRRFRLFPLRSPLLGESIFLSPPPGTKMFQFPGFAPSIRRSQAFSLGGCPIRTHPDQSLFAGPRAFSQLTASFIACRSQGILRTPLLLFLSK